MESKKITGTIKITGTTKKPENWLPQKIKENPFQFFWSLSLTLGGVILIIFFLQIGFMPDMSFSEASGIFIAVASVGLLIGLLIGFLIVLPMLLAMMLAILTQTSEFVKYSYENIYLFLFNTFLSIGFLCLLVILHPLNHWICICVIYIILCVFISCLRRRFIFTKSQKNKRQTDNEQTQNANGPGILKNERLFIFYDALFWFFYPIISLMLFFISGGFDQNIEIDTFILFAFWVALTCIFAYILIICSGTDNLRLQLFIFISYIVLSLALMGIVKRYPSAIIRSLGLGEMRNVSVLLKKEGCDAFNAISMPAGQKPLCDEKTKIVRSVHLISRIASPYVFEVTGRDNLAWRITIPKEQVISLIISGVHGSQPPNPGASNNQTQDCPDWNQSPNPPQQGCASAAQNGAAAATK